MIYKYISQLSNMQRRLIDRLAKDKDYSGTEGKLIHYLFWEIFLIMVTILNQIYLILSLF